MSAAGALARRIVRSARPRQIRLREREFWRTQAFVAAATAVVYAGDWYEFNAGMDDGLHDVLTTVYLAPVLYAAFAYGLEGVLLTTLWCALVGAPHAVISPHSDQMVSDAGVLATILVAGVAVALRVESERESLRQYARNVTTAQEEERRRLARDLHDGVTQTLSGLCRELDLLQSEIVDAHNSATVARLREEASEALVDIRRVARDLRPATLDDLGLVPAIESLVEELGDRSGLEVTVRTSGRLRRLSSDHQLCAFRIVQEALTNVEKHAQASTVVVEIAFDEHSMRVTVQDDGVGFQSPSSTSELARGGRFGLLGMRERAALHDGVLAISTEPGRGTAVTLRIESEAGEEHPLPAGVRRSAPR